MIIETYIDETITEKLVSTLDKLVDNKLTIEHNSSSSQEAHQTNNLANYAPLQPILRDILNHIEFEKPLLYRWFHMISYDHQGYQLKHDHADTEDYSFILYLTTCSNGGETAFEIGNNEVLKIKPIKNKLIFFPSYYVHWGESTKDKKKVAVGALIVND
jgi:hypothetical protein